MGPADRAAWTAMRCSLWPDDTKQTHADAIDELLRTDGNWGLVAETFAGEAVGFAEIALRAYANGCDTRPVPFLEGIWVKPEFRRRGIGTLLIQRAKALLAARGFIELGSDTLIDNTNSQAAHRAWGFIETERVVYFRMIIQDRSG